MVSKEYIGIDFGTTNTAVVYIQDDELGRRVRLLGDAEGNPFSSIVAVAREGQTLQFGRALRDKRTEMSETHQIFTSMKSYLGTDHEFIVGQHRYSAVDITAEFLKHIKRTIVQQHGIDIRSASFSFPVDFSPEARHDLQEAAQRAGVETAALVSESTAAYLANRAECTAFSTVMVLDWGGGTLDISILKLHHTEVHEVAVSGFRVGGDDIDRVLAERIHAEIAGKSDVGAGVGFDNMSSMEKDQMIARCEQAKIYISDSDDDDDYHITLQDYGIYGTKTKRLVRTQFDAIVEPIIEDKVLSTIKDALIKAKLSTALIDAVIVVGGSSNLRVYEYAITNLFHHAKIIFPEKRQWSAAEGAALMQIIGGNFTLNDDLGVKLSDDSVFSIFEKGKSKVGDTQNPITFSLTEDTQDAHFIFTDGSGKNKYKDMSVPTKGFYQEKLVLHAELGRDQIARIKVESKAMGESAIEQCEINQLPFFYDLKDLG